MSGEKTVILLPVYNDWLSLELLLKDLATGLNADHPSDYEVVVVNDGSLEERPGSFAAFAKTTILHLTHNIGHQKAIAIGLSFINHEIPCDRVLIMDADGDDRPDDALKMLTASRQSPGKIVVGWRTSRQDHYSRNFSYKIYIAVFRLLTGKKMRFGNFSVLPFFALKPLIFKGDIWHHLPGGIIRSKIPYQIVSTSKGKRYEGKSKMSYVSLVYHGMGALAAFIDTIAIRLLIASGIAIGISLLALLFIFFIRLSTDLAIPGWASILGASIVIILLLSFLIALFLIFTFMSSQSYRKFVPAVHYREFIARTENLLP